MENLFYGVMFKNYYVVFTNNEIKKGNKVIGDKEEKPVEERKSNVYIYKFNKYIENIYIKREEKHPILYKKKLDVKKDTIKGELKSSEYEELTDYFKNMYEVEEEKQEVFYDKCEILYLGRIEKEYEDDNKGSNYTIFQQYEGIPQEFHKYLPQYINKGELLREIYDYLKDFEGKTLNLKYWDSIGKLDINIYEKEYQGETKDVEIKKSNGSSYKKPRYRKVKSTPESIKRYVFDKKDFPIIEGKDEEEVSEKINKIIRDIMEV